MCLEVIDALSTSIEARGNSLPCARARSSPTRDIHTDMTTSWSMSVLYHGAFVSLKELDISKVMGKVTGEAVSEVGEEAGFSVSLRKWSLLDAKVVGVARARIPSPSAILPEGVQIRFEEGSFRFPNPQRHSAVSSI